MASEEDAVARILFENCAWLDTDAGARTEGASVLVGGAAMEQKPPTVQREDDLGAIRAGALADLLVVDGNPLEDRPLLGDQGAHLDVVMKAGEFAVNRL